METLLIDYRDPLFAILLIGGMVFAIAFVSYWWGVYVKSRKSRRLQRFLKRFDVYGAKKSLEKMPYSPAMREPLVLLARAYEKNGEYTNAIEIGLYLIEHCDDETLTYELMELVGTTYMHAGFLERAHSIFLQILKSNPRNKKVLNDLMVVYERLQNFRKAREVVESLEAMGVDVKDLKLYIELKSIVSDVRMKSAEKIERIVDFYRKHDRYERIVFDYLLRNEPQRAWEMIDEARVERMIDIFWYLPASSMDYDRIGKNPVLRAVYGARGDLEPSEPVGVFPLDMMNHLKRTGFEKATLQFAYLCNRCKQQFPVPFERCPKCLALDSAVVETEITKVNDETDFNLL
ncbi:tetratricopeptide repeat protein [Hydrogenimonas sp.]